MPPLILNPVTAPIQSRRPTCRLPSHLPAMRGRHWKSKRIESKRQSISWSNSCLYRHINQEALEIVLLVPSVRI